MELKKKLNKELVTPTVIFIFLILAASFLFFSYSDSLNNIIHEAEPAQAAINHMVLDVYRDNIILLEYLNTNDYISAVKLDDKVDISNQKCSDVKNSIENLIITNALSDQEIISQYEVAYTVHEQVENLRDKLIDLHKEELATGRMQYFKKSELLNNHSVLLDSAIEEFTLAAESIEERNKKIEKTVALQTRIYTVVVLILVISLITITLIKARKLSQEVIDPIDKTIIATKKFVEGDYESKIQPKSEIQEIFDLENNINAVFSVIKKTSDENLDKKKEIDIQLLKKEYLKIIYFIKQNTLQQKRTNISDIKKEFNITHPTVLERLKYLEKRKLINIQKEGREKFLILTGKF